MHTVGAFVRILLGEDPQRNGWKQSPPSPPDVFAVCASLLKRAGAYQHILPEPGVSDHGIVLLISPQDRRDVQKAARDWRTQLRPAMVRNWWQQLVDDYRRPVFSEGSTATPEWWRPAALLMAAADSASEGIGFGGKVNDSPWYAWSLDEFLSAPGATPPASISRVSTGLHCVLPKSRTPTIGATLRSLSHHLALLPPEGVAAARWINRGQEIKDHGPLNLLLVPFPYSIPATCFKPQKDDPDENWGSFDLSQKWLMEDSASQTSFVNFVEELIEVACREVGSVHAVVFPELSLNAEYFEKLSKTLQNSTQLEFLVAGVSEHPKKRQRGNYVATTYYFDQKKRSERHAESEEQQVLERARIVRVRAKHHRWKLDGRQICRYALGSVLDPTKSWWENFNVEPREVHVVRFRKNSTLATLICEDLARIDPCQELIRAIGPSLVLVLLMDGPQLKQRWPARYATVLADDPGSSVLTLTSLGLINRQNHNGDNCLRSIALWKDNTADTVELCLPSGCHALALTLNPKKETSYTMDGRAHSGSIAWHLGGVHPIKVPHAEHFSQLLDGT